MKRITGLALVLAIFWIINSGHFDGLLLGLGLVSLVLVIVITRRMQTVDGEYEPPVLLSFRLPLYMLWLAWEIIKSNIDVVRRIWQPSPDISPTVFKVCQPEDGCL